MSRASGSIAAVKERTMETVETARESLDKGKETLREVSTQATDAARSAAGQLDEGWQKVQKSSSQAVERTETTMSSHPFVTAAVAGTLGFVLGALLLGSRDRS